MIIGEAIGKSGPAIILSFVLAGRDVRVLARCRYAELASTIPVSGSAYTYSLRDAGRARRLDHRLGPDPRVRRLGRRGRGRLGRVLNDLLDSLFGITLPDSIAGPPGDGGTVNLPAVFLVLAVTALLCVGVRESARTNTVMVVIKLAVLALFVVLGVTRASNGATTSRRSPRTASPAWSTPRR